MNTTTPTKVLQWLRGPVQGLPSGSAADVEMRLAGDADIEQIERLAQLDSRRAPRGPVLVADVEGDLWAAVSLDDGHGVADPFHPTGELLALLTTRAQQLRRGNGRRRTRDLPRVFPKAGYDHPAWS